MELKDIFSKGYVISLLLVILALFLIYFSVFEHINLDFINMIILKINLYTPTITLIISLVTIVLLKIMRKEQLYIKEIVKNPAFMQRIKKKINELKKDIYNDAKIENKELFDTLDNGITHALNVFDEILAKNFVFEDEKELYSIVYNEMRLIKKEVKIDIFLSEVYKKEHNKHRQYIIRPVNEFFEYLEIQVLVPEMQTFVKNTVRVSKTLKNGIRRAEFEKICLNIILNIINNTIDFYKKY